MRHHSYSSVNALQLFNIVPNSVYCGVVSVSPEATEDGRSLENKANNVGPKTEPCGTPT